MQADDVYRFVTLRDVAPRAPEPYSDPFISAYSSRRPPTNDGFRSAITEALRANDIEGARVLARNLLGTDSAWTRLFEGPGGFRDFFLSLPRFARGNARLAAIQALLKVLAISTPSELVNGLQRVVDQRAVLADYFGAAALVGDVGSDLDGAAHLITCCEATERLIFDSGASSPSDIDEPPSDTGSGELPARPLCTLGWLATVFKRERQPLARSSGAAMPVPQVAVLNWTIPLTHGIVTLPFALSARAANSRVGLTSATAPAPNAALNPPQVRPSSFIGDLIVLKQQLRRYELGEIANVENVLARENATRVYRNLRRSETRLLNQTEVESEVSRDLQATTRDELSSEIQKAISEQTDLSANFNVSATYLGPGITVNSSAGGAASYRRSSEERATTASAHSHEVVARASERIKQRTLTQREQIETEETENTATHGINNTSDVSIVGVYRWLERSFDLHLVNYGRRRIYELILPEPAAYWTALLTVRGDLSAGPAPAFPQISAYTRGEPPPPPPVKKRDLALSDFLMQDTVGEPEVRDERPFKWEELVSLAGEWGVTLQEPPPPSLQIRYSITIPPDAADAADSKAPQFGPDPNAADFNSKVVKSAQPEKPFTVPDGYRAFNGNASLRVWRRIGKYPEGDQYVYESGRTVLLLNGQIHTLDAFWRETRRADETKYEELLPDLAKIFLPGIGRSHWFEGELPIVLTTSCDGASCSIVLNAERTSAHALDWGRQMFDKFSKAYADRLARYEDERAQALNSNLDWGRGISSSQARDIERRELKRGVIAVFAGVNLSELGDSVLSEPAGGIEPTPKIPVLNASALPEYEKIVRFFEFAFDWNNIAYVFPPYIYGRRSKWTNLALADGDDAQFKTFLGAGSARVQVPVRLGYEAHVEYFFSGLGIRQFEDRVPWLESMRSLALDLAEAASGGFADGAGRVNVKTDSRELNGIGTLFRDPDDSDREIRLGRMIYIVEEVLTPARLLLRTPYLGATLFNSPYQLGGIVIGPSEELKLPTTLVAIDKPDLVLPKYSGRYVE